MPRPRVYPTTCTVNGCERPHHSGGLCRAHYQRQLTHGEPGPAEIGRYGGGTCSADGCRAPAHSRACASGTTTSSGGKPERPCRCPDFAGATDV